MPAVFLIAVFCVQAPPPNPYLRETPAIEIPACLPHKEEFAGSVTDCSHYSLREVPRLKALYGAPFAFRGVYCLEDKR
jgi:hypothetical protein